MHESYSKPCEPDASEDDTPALDVAALIEAMDYTEADREFAPFCGLL